MEQDSGIGDTAEKIGRNHASRFPTEFDDRPLPARGVE